jgi:hypothetical protein
MWRDVYEIVVKRTQGFAGTEQRIEEMMYVR